MKNKGFITIKLTREIIIKVFALGSKFPAGFATRPFPGGGVGGWVGRGKVGLDGMRSIAATYRSVWQGRRPSSRRPPYLHKGTKQTLARGHSPQVYCDGWVTYINLCWYQYIMCDLKITNTQQSHRPAQNLRALQHPLVGLNSGCGTINFLFEKCMYACIKENIERIPVGILDLCTLCICTYINHIPTC